MWDVFRVWLESSWPWLAAEKLGNLSQVAMSLAAGIALGVGISQIRSTTAASREATLRALNQDQNRLCFENPRFANPALGKLDVEQRMFDGSPDLFEKYIWFVVIGLVVAERALKIGEKREWKTPIEDFYLTHDRLLSSTAFAKHWETFDTTHQLHWTAWSSAQKRHES